MKDEIQKKLWISHTKFCNSSIILELLTNLFDVCKQYEEWASLYPNGAVVHTPIKKPKKESIGSQCTYSFNSLLQFDACTNHTTYLVKKIWQVFIDLPKLIQLHVKERLNYQKLKVRAQMRKVESYGREHWGLGKTERNPIISMVDSVVGEVIILISLLKK